ncbi:AbiJ-NTD4 domain-containing protein [Marinomonas dokdonensis]|uniref:AbiJ-NTD4 domain-containing protein n=1 Tax=Marinomonas dokdonensis TaxID=328224 RepID=UPI0040556896
MKYFSDSERGALPRTNNEIPYNVWYGLTAYIQQLIDTGYFGDEFPDICPDGQGCCGTDERIFSSHLKAEIPRIEYPFITEKKVSDDWMSKRVPFTPDYLEVLDLVQFCYANVSKPTLRQFHSFFGHHHITSFDRSAGQAEFLDKVDTMFSRNGVAYRLNADGQITRILNPSLGSVIGQVSKTLDQELDDLIEKANTKICNTDVQVRYEALKQLWDAFERIKTVFNPSQSKKQSMTQLLDVCASDKEFRDQLESEAKALTDIGNTFFIRHSEVTQVKLNDSDHIEYLFHRLASFICLLAKKLG